MADSDDSKFAPNPRLNVQGADEMRVAAKDGYVQDGAGVRRKVLKGEWIWPGWEADDDLVESNGSRVAETLRRGHSTG
jgi:hypothetical protein